MHHHHEHGHGHDHHDLAPMGRAGGRVFAIGATINLAYVIVEALWGFHINSTALLADAGHNLGDVIGLIGGLVATWMSGWHPSAQYTYGFRRSSILAALANAVILLVVTGAIASEAAWRLAHPETTQGIIILIVAGAGVVVNGVTAWLLAVGRKGDLNIRAAFAHMAADTALAAGVMIAGAVISVTDWQRIDPAASLVISVVIVVGTWSLLRESVSLSLDAVPAGIDLHAVEAYLRTLPSVREVHDLHVWALSTTETALTAHVVRDGTDRDAALLACIPVEVRERFGIGHATIQLETADTAHACDLRPAHVI